MARREIVKRRIGSEGVDIECEADDTKYVDKKDDKKATYKQGRGRAFRKTVYTYAPHSTRRAYIDPPLRIKNPRQESTFIDYQEGVIKHYWVKSGRGRFFRKTRILFDNTEENTTRKVREQRVEGEDNPADYIDVERVKEFKLASGRGFVARKKKVTRRHEEEEIEAMEGPCITELEE
jgi:hypothetical protein